MGHFPGTCSAEDAYLMLTLVSHRFLKVGGYRLLCGRPILMVPARTPPAAPLPRADQGLTHD
jgi:hypothetical protein